MKTLDRLTNVERAKLLFALHPGAIPGFIEYAIKQVNSQLQSQNIEALKKQWSNGLISLPFWISLFYSLQATFNTYGTKVSKNKNLFADQVFDGYLALVSTTLLSNYIKHSDNKKFNEAVTLLFT